MPFPNRDTQFKPGVTANPKGRPTGRAISSRLRDLLEKGEINGRPIKDGKQVADLLTEVILKQALGGDHRFIEMVLNRTEGKVPETAAAAPADQAPRLMPKLTDERYPDDPDENPDEDPGGG